MKMNMSVEELEALLIKVADQTLDSAPDMQKLDFADGADESAVTYEDEEDFDEYEGEELDLFEGEEEVYEQFFGTGTTVEPDVPKPTEPIFTEKEAKVEQQKPAGGTPNNAEIINFNTAREQLENRDFFKKSPEQKFESVDQAVQQIVNDTVPDDVFLKECETEVLKHLKPYMSKNVQKARKYAYNSKSTDRHWKSNTMYKQDVLEVGGKDVKINRVKETPRWTLDLQDCVTNDDKARNFDQVRTKLTEEIVNYFGGFNRIQKIYVNSLQLVINDVIYTPLLSDTILARLPFDSADYVKNGYLAPLFDWGYLTKMSSLSVLSIDDFDFAMQNIGSDLGKGRDFKPMSLFNTCKNLTYLELGGEVVTYPLNTESEEVAQSIQHIEEEARSYGKFDEMYTKCYDRVGSTLGGFRGWTVNNLKDYANNRGNKGIFKYTGGLLARAGVSAVAGTVELGVKGVGYLLRGIGRTLKDATTPVTLEDTKK